jgi:hypothetical protein
MPLFVAIPAAFPVAKAAIVGLGTIALGAMALFFGKRQLVSEPPKSSQPENSQTPPTPTRPALTLIARGRAELQRTCTRASKVVREAVRASVEAIKRYAHLVATVACKLCCNITKADIARRLGLALLQLGMVQSFAVEGLLKGLLKSPPRTRAPSFAG